MKNNNAGFHSGWLFAAVIMASLIGLIALMNWWQPFLSERLFRTGYLSVGLLLGVVIIIVPVILTALHNRSVGNGSDRDE